MRRKYNESSIIKKLDCLETDYLLICTLRYIKPATKQKLPKAYNTWLKHMQQASWQAASFLMNAYLIKAKSATVSLHFMAIFFWRFSFGLSADTVMFGLKPAPKLVLLATDETERFPLASKNIQADVYVVSKPY